MKFKVQLLGFALFCSNYLTAQCPEGTITMEQNLVKNGDFELPTLNFYTEYKQSKIANAGLFDIVRDAHPFKPSCFTGTGDNYFMAVDGAAVPNKVVWQQTIPVKPQTFYSFSIWASTLEIQFGPPAVLLFSLNDKLSGEPFDCPDVTNKWEQFSTSWYSENNNTVVIKIVSQNPILMGNDFGLDRIKFYECSSDNFDEQLNKAKVGAEIELRNILFETGESMLMPESFGQLNKLIHYLKKNPGVVIKIAGHTDNTGNVLSNLRLSEDRAKSVAWYLCQKGIGANRLEMVGYGDSQPVSTNDTADGRQINRRVTIKILSNSTLPE